MPRPHPRESRPQSRFCRYEDSQGRRCRRIATVDEKLCREHAITLRMELEGSRIEQMIGAIDRKISRSHDPVLRAFGDLISGLFSGAPQPPPRSSQQQQPRQNPGRASPPRPQPAPSPELEARRIMGFDRDARLTAELVKQRKKALGQLFHPDKCGGSTEAMARVNSAADVLLAKLS